MLTYELCVQLIKDLNIKSGNSRTEQNMINRFLPITSLRYHILLVFGRAFHLDFGTVK